MQDNQKRIIDFEKYELANGVRVVLAPDERAVATIAQVLVATGSKYETKTNNGISHFLEHMVFKGTKTRPSTKAIAEEVDSVGGQMNAFTGQEETGYWIKMPTEHSALALELVADIYLNPLLEQKEIEKERGVILQEIAMYEDMPMRKVEEVFEELLYGDQPAGWPIIGQEENIQKMTAGDLKKYIREQYLPAETVVTVAGNFSVPEIKKQIQDLFGRKRKTDKRNKRPAVKERQRQPRLQIEEKDTDQTHLVLGFRSYNMFDRRKYTLSLLSSILGGGMSSRMFLRIREKEGLAYYIHTASETNLDTGVFAIQAGVSHDNLEKTIKLILQEVLKVAKKKVTGKELKKAKDKIKGSFTMGLETIQSRAGFLANQELFKRDIKTVKYILEQYDKVTAEDIQKVAQQIFKNSKLNLAIIGPHKNNEKKLKEILKVS